MALEQAKCQDNRGNIVAPGIYGADIAELRTLSKSLAASGAREYVCLPMNGAASILDMVEATVDDAVQGARHADGGMVSARRYTPGLRPMVANVRIATDGALHLASEPLDADGQLAVRVLDANEQPGTVVRALLAVAP